jgi:hypothetical protein
VAVAGEPAGQFLVGIGAAGGVDLGNVFRILGEFDDQPVGRGDIDRFAIAVIGLAVFRAGFLAGAFRAAVSARHRSAARP